jgi:hypothetical protein
MTTEIAMTQARARELAQDVILHHGVHPAMEFTMELLTQHMERRPTSDEYALVRAQAAKQADRVLKLMGFLPKYASAGTEA